MSTIGSAPRSRENTRARLIQAASEVFAESGVDGASVEAICERAGFTRGAFYSNFASKDELLLELMRDVSDRQIERVRSRVRQLRETSAPLVGTGELVAQVLDITPEERIGVVLMSEIRTNAMRDEALAEAYLALQAAMISRVESIIGDLVDEYGITLRMPAHEAARLLIVNWESTSTYVAIARLSPAEGVRLVTERTVLLAGAIAELPAATPRVAAQAAAVSSDR